MKFTLVKFEHPEYGIGEVHAAGIHPFDSCRPTGPCQHKSRWDIHWQAGLGRWRRVTGRWGELGTSGGVGTVPDVVANEPVADSPCTHTIVCVDPEVVVDGMSEVALHETATPLAVSVAVAGLAVNGCPHLWRGLSLCRRPCRELMRLLDRWLSQFLAVLRLCCRRSTPCRS